MNYRLMKLQKLLSSDLWQIRGHHASLKRWNELRNTLIKIQQEIKQLDSSFGTLLPWQDGRDQYFVLIHKLGCC